VERIERTRRACKSQRSIAAQQSQYAQRSRARGNVAPFVLRVLAMPAVAAIVVVAVAVLIVPVLVAILVVPVLVVPVLIVPVAISVLIVRRGCADRGENAACDHRRREKSDGNWS